MSWQPNLAKHDPAAARAYVRDSLRGPDFALTWNRLSGDVKAARARLGSETSVPGVLEEVRGGTDLAAVRFAVAVLEEELLSAYRSDTRIAEVTGEALVRVLARRERQLELAQWPGVQGVLEEASLVVQQKNQTVVVGATRNGLLRVVLRTLDDPAALEVLDVRPVGQGTARQARQSGKVVRDGL